MAELSRALTIDQYVHIASEDIRENDNVLCDVGEAVIGAIYVDGGSEKALEYVRAKWKDLLHKSHNPPKDTNLDRTDSGAHVGSAGIRKFIEDCQPLLVVSGHIHESRGVDKIGRTRLVNPGALAEGFYAVAEISFSGGTANIEGIGMHSLSLPD